MTKFIFPLVERLGLEITNPYNTVSYSGQKAYMIHAERLESLLEKATVVKGYRDEKPHGWTFTEFGGPMETHSALLLGIREIKPVMAEDLLREIDEIVLDGIPCGGSTGFGVAIDMKKAERIAKVLTEAKAFLERSRP